MFPGLTGGTLRNNPWTNMRGLDKDNMTQVGPIATQNLGGNSLTQQMRSLQNYLTAQGAGTFEAGKDITGMAIPGFGTAGDTTGTALGTTQGALGSLSPAESYWTKLLSGDQATMNQAIAPVATQAGQNYANARTLAEQNMPRGGYANVLSAGLPQAQAREINQVLYNLQPTAATNLNTIAGTKNQIAANQGNIAATQGQLANWLASLGIDTSKLGGMLMDVGNMSLMTGRGQDVQEHGQAMSLAGQLGSALLSPFGAGMAKKWFG